MKRIILSSIAFLVFVAPAFAKGETIKITIEGPSLKAPVTLTDPQVLASFNIWSGPGTLGCESPATRPCVAASDVKMYAPSFVVDWSQGVVTAPSPALPHYKVSFWASDNPRKLAYVVTYVLDPATGYGYVYLPGAGDDGHYINAGSIARSPMNPDAEGKWFRAWSEWDKVASPLLVSSLK